MALSQVSASLNLSIYDKCLSNSPKVNAFSKVPTSSFAPISTSFVCSSPLVMRTSSARAKTAYKANTVSIRCGQSANEGSGLDVWLGRLAMIGFAMALTVEVSTGKGLLENFGLTSPLPTVALAVTALVGILTAVFIFQSASKN